MIKAGITGGIGAGKTVMCRIFETLGIPVFNADTLSKDILSGDPGVIQELKGILGEEVFKEDGPDRKKIAEIIFNDAEKLRQVNMILHSATLKRFGEWCAGQKDAPYVLIETALIFEAGLEKKLDKVIVVTAPESLRIQRTMERDQLSEEEVRARMRNQIPGEENAAKADFVIVNDGSQVLIPQVVMIHERLRSL